MYVLKEDVSPEKQIQEWSKDMPYISVDELSTEDAWVSTAEEDLIEESLVHQWLCESGEINESSDQDKVYQPWDIIMINTHDIPGLEKHRILLVESGVIDDGCEYSGFEFSSNLNKANKNNNKYPDNLYISSYASILQGKSDVNKPIILKIDHLVKFTNENLSEHGTHKGRVNNEFREFVKEAYNNYRNGRSDLNAAKYWEK